MSESTVEMPEDFRRIGFSGLFHIETALTGTREEWEGKRLPWLLPNPGWVLASVDLDAMTGVLVRRDSNAVVEAFTTPRR